MNAHTTKLIAAAVFAMFMLPVIASAQATTTPNRGEAATSTALMRAAQTVTNQATQVQKTADLMAAMSLKLSLRVASSTATSTEITAATALLTDLNAKIADARLQATAAFGHVGSATAASSTKANTNAELKKARADIVVARQDFAAARKDIDKILRILRVLK